MANIKDIAKMAGVSVTTVSRVLNDHPYVSEEKRQAVLQAMEQSNYQPNVNAVHLSRGATRLVGVVIPFINHPYFGLLLEGIAEEALKNNYKLVMIQTNYEEERELEALTMLKHKQFDALIICSRICPWQTIEDYLEYGPIVLSEDARGKEVSSTFIDHYGAFTEALEYLSGKGYGKIGYCIGRKSGLNSMQRERAYKDFLKKRSEPFDEGLVFSGCFNFEDGEKVVKQFKVMENPPSALLVTSDQVAAGIITCCRAEGIEIPGDLAVMGFDNQPIAKIMKITTLEIPLVEMGRNLLQQAIHGDKVLHKEMSVRLISRETV
ncbi:LacI family DNA-binding transcriptional regulator [Bacillus sp. SG-1]|uniref:LacI family DNA-binding transcriptional regulator n=1 Tax=Bacillus sp. SG-1 TaxID=161544 RepID=UPI0005C567AF|nr:LacI family DNA-binding transcriptional regulator [Bacillus sp. SG-1]